ncbi:protein containing Peptidase M1, membrane alanine aminopeptidase, partial [mine drainage metagenome]
YVVGKENEASLRRKRLMVQVIAHELAHQWFGDLVTMNWWDEVWLNESFAEFMMYKATDVLFPEWGMKEEYLYEVIDDAFIEDGLKNTHEISRYVRQPWEIDSAFDPITYEKGGAVLHMFEGYTGSETFRKGLHNYLKEHSYSNASGNDLWESIDVAGKKEGR